MNHLTIDGQPIRLTAEYAIRWVDLPDGSNQPVLYYLGKRVTQPWTLALEIANRGDPSGANANTA